MSELSTALPASTSTGFTGGGSEISGPFVEVPVIRIKMYWGLFAGPPFMETSHLRIPDSNPANFLETFHVSRMMTN